MDEIRQFRGSTPVMTREAEDAARSRLLREMRDPALALAPAPASVKRRRRPRLAWRLGLAAAAAVAIAGGMTVVRGADHPATVTVASVQELGERAAEASEADPDGVVPSPGQWRYWKITRATQISEPRPEMDPVKRETVEGWDSLDGRQTAYIDETGKIAIEQIVQDFEDVVEDVPRVSGADLAQEPVTPEGVLAKVTEIVEKAPASPFGGDASKQQLVFQAILNLMSQEPLTPEARAALFRALPMIEGVTLKQDAVDAAGRAGVAFAFAGETERLEIILSSEDFRFLGTYSETLTEQYHNQGIGLVKPGSIMGWTAQLGVGVVDKPGDRP
ncbi:CU044_5270 family protein [Nonomuraea sp. bgisy101]|uniref:CU044_5270 family protein n=1 Tax=Nonomuraea sp. bgisy101 TaxID=3413784 RepID=UPI003D70737C